MDIFDYVKGVCESARAAAPATAASASSARDAALLRAAELLSDERERAAILAENEADVRAARENGVREAMIDRLSLNAKRLSACADSLRELARLPDPLGRGDVWTRPNGLVISRVTVPLGVVGIIYEARPSVTVDAAALAVKSGNCAVLRGGSEALRSNRALASLLRRALADSGLPEDGVCLIDDGSRASSSALMKMRGLVDVLVPRGGAGLIRAVCAESTVPVIETGAGNCHMYVDESADIDTAVKLAINAKASRPSVCNAIETLLVHATAAPAFFDAFAPAAAEAGIELRGCDRTRGYISCAAATDEDYATEYNDLILAVRVVDSIDSAVEHIAKYSTHHSECICTTSVSRADEFVRRVDSAAVYVNASTRFTDGGEFGFGAELGISTQKMHARGPMGLSALTSVKYIVRGDGQIRL